MKKNYIITLFALVFFASISAQESQKNFINYQGVARDAENNLMEQEAITVGIALKFGSAATTAAYQENHTVTTDANGVFSLKIGNGNTVSGSYENLPWGTAAFIEVSLNDSALGTTELMAVPYAIASGDKQWTVNGQGIENKNEGEVNIKNNLKVKGGFNLSMGNQVNEISDDGALAENSNGILPTQRAVKTYVDNKAFGGAGGFQTAAEVPYDNSASGLTAADTQAAIDELVTGGGGSDGDTDATNEFQDLSLSGTILEISDGTGVDLSPIIPPGGTDDQNAAEVSFDNTGSGLSATDTQAAIDELASGGLVDTDNQDLSLSGTILQITDGASVDLSPIVPVGGTDDQIASEVPFDNTVSGLTAIDTQSAIDELASSGLVDTDDQGLVLTGDILTIEDGTGSIDLSVYGDDGDADPTNEIDVTAETGILMGDGTTVSGLVGTADGDVAKWDADAAEWIAAPDEIGGGGAGTPSGLEALDEGSGIGWRLIGKDPEDYGSIGLNAVDLSHHEENLPNGGATGSYAVASGWNTRALGDWSTATGRQTAAEGDGSFSAGWQNIASGDYSVVMGRETQASGSRSVAMGMETSARNIAAFSMGMGTVANGRYSSAMGINTKSDAQGSFAVGKFNTGGGDPDNWVGTDPIFEVGIGGNVSTRANALTVLKNGNVGVGESVPTVKLHVDGNIRSTDLAGAGERNVVADASGNLIISAGSVGGSSPWLENGNNIHFNGGRVGIGTADPEDRLHVAGDMLLQSNFGILKIGYINNGNQWALATKNNGGNLLFRSKPSGTNSFKTRFQMWQDGELHVGDISGNQAWVHVLKNSKVSKPHLKIEEIGDDFARIELTNSSTRFWHLAGYVGNTIAKDRFNIYNSDVGNIFSVHGNGNIVVNGAIAHSSDRRLKKDIVELPYGLETVMQLSPKAYYWKKGDTNEHRALGLIAQDVQQIIEEVVHGGTDEEDMLSISYTELVPVLIKAIQEQQAIIEDGSQKISSLEERLQRLEARLSK